MTELELLNEQGSKILKITGWPNWEASNDKKYTLEYSPQALRWLYCYRDPTLKGPDWDYEWSTAFFHVALCIVKEHLRRWLWEKHYCRITCATRWLIPTVLNYIPKKAHASLRTHSLICGGKTFPTELAAQFAAVKAVTENTDEKETS